MATEVGSAYVSVWPKLDGSQWANQIKQALGSAGVSGGQSLSKGVSSGLSSAKVAIGTLLASVASSGINAIRNSLDSAISRVDTLNNFPKVMSNIGFSTEEANKAVSKLGEGIDGLPTTLDGIVKNTQAFALSLGDLGQAADVAIAVNDGMLAFGATSEGASEAVRQLNQMITAGKYDMQSWNSINSAAPGMLDAIARSMLGEKATASQLRDALNGGKISTQDFLNAIVKMDQEGGAGFASFSQLARESTGGIATSMSNMKTAVTKNLANIIDAFNGTGAISQAFDGIKNIINGLGTAFLPLAEVFGSITAVISEKFVNLSQSIKERCGEFAEAFRSSFEKTQNIAIAFADALERAFSGTMLGSAFSVLSDAVRAFFFSLQDGKGFIDALKNALDEIPAKAQVIMGAFAAIGGAAVFTKVVSEAGKAAIAVWKIGEQATLAASRLPLIGGAFATLNAQMTTTHSAVTAFGGGFTGLGKILSANVSNAFTMLSGKMAAFSSAVTFAGGGLRGVITVIGSMLGPIGIAAVAIAGLAAVFAILWNTNEEFRQSMTALGQDLMTSLQPAIDSIMQAFSQMASAVMPAIMALIQALIPIITLIVTTLANLAATVLPMLANLLTSILVPAITLIAQILTAVIPIIANIVSFIAEAIATIVSIVMPILQAIIDFIVANLPTIQGVFETVMNAVKSVVETVWPLIQTIIETAMKVIQDVINIVLAIIKGDWSAVWEGIKQLANDIWDGICNIVDTAINTALNVIQTVLDTISNIWNTIWSAISDFAGNTWDNICSIVQGAIDTVSGAIDSALSAISDWWNSTWSEISSFISNTWSDICSTVSDGVGNVINFIGEIPGKVMGFFNDAGSWLINAGRAILEGLWNGMKAIWDGITGWLSSLGGIIMSIKGPEDYDKKLLIPAGEWIMGGLDKGLKSGFEEVKSTLASATNEISGFSAMASVGVDSDWRNLPSSNQLISTYGLNKSTQGGRLTRDDIFDAFADAMSTAGEQAVNLYLDGKLVATTLSPYTDQALAVQATRRGRF